MPLPLCFTVPHGFPSRSVLLVTTNSFIRQICHALRPKPFQPLQEWLEALPSPTSLDQTSGQLYYSFTAQTSQSTMLALLLRPNFGLIANFLGGRSIRASPTLHSGRKKVFILLQAASVVLKERLFSRAHFKKEQTAVTPLSCQFQLSIAQIDYDFLPFFKKLYLTISSSPSDLNQRNVLMNSVTTYFKNT